MSIWPPLQALLDDHRVSEVMINGPGAVWVEREGTLVMTDVHVDDRTLGMDPADHRRQDRQRVGELQPADLAVIGVHHEVGARLELGHLVGLAGEAVGAGPAGRDDLDLQTRLADQPGRGRELAHGGPAGLAALLFGADVLEVAFVPLQASKAQSGQVLDPPGQRQNLRVAPARLMSSRATL